MKRLGFIDGRRVAGWSFPATATPGNGQVMTINDRSAGGTGDVYGQTINYNAIGAKTGHPFVGPLSLNLNVIGGAAPTPGYQAGLSISTSLAAALHSAGLYGMFIYMNALGAGATVTEHCALSLNMNNTVAPTSFSTFLRCYAHGAGHPVESVISLPSSVGIEYLVDIRHGVLPLVLAAPGAFTRKIAVQLAGSPWYIGLSSS